MLDIYEKIYERLIWEKRDAFDRLPSRRLDELKDKLRIWQDRIGVLHHSLKDHPDAYFDQAWSLIYKSTPQGKRDSNSAREVYIVALKADTGEFQQLSFMVNKSHISTFRTPQRIAQALQENGGLHRRSSASAQFNIHVRSSSINSTGLSFGYLRERMDLEYEDAAWALDSVVRTFMRNSSISNGEIPRTLGALKLIGEEVFKSHFDTYLKTIENHLDFTALGYANRINLDVPIKRDHGQVAVYNHLIRNRHTYENARDYRYTALQQFIPLGTLFLEEPFWDRIDAGEPPIRAFADHIGVKPATIKHMARQVDLFRLGRETLKIAPYLDAVDPALWPKTKEDLQAVSYIIDIAEIYGTTFNRKPAEALGAWASQKKKLLARSWHHMLHDILKEQIGKIVEQGRIKGAPALKTYMERLYPDPIEKIKESYDNLPDLKQGYADFWKYAVERYKSDMGEIKDMKADVERRILLPILLRGIGELGYRAMDMAALSGLKTKASEKLWSLMPPSDQISASRYWHSPNVDLQRRFNSAALADSTFAEWPPLFEGDIKADNGMIIHPLLGSAALTDESNNMDHCIWSYSSYFYTWNCHMFSLRDKDGNRLSSLTIKDHVDDYGHRQVKFSQNKAHGNANPSSLAVQAAEWLISQINEKKIVPDWRAIDEARSEYKAREVENTVGYDYHNKEQCENVLKVYTACLPRRTVPTDGASFDHIASVLGVGRMVRDQISEYDFSQGGFAKTQDRQQPAVHMPPAQGLHL